MVHGYACFLAERSLGFEDLDKVVKCRKFREAFVYDEVLFIVYNMENKLGWVVLRLWLVDHRYGSLVNLRLHQTIKWKQLLNEQKLIQSKRINLRRLQYIFLTNLYRYQEMFIARWLQAVYSFSVSVYADIGKGFWGSMRNLAIAVGVKIGKHAHVHGNVTIAIEGKYAPAIGDNVHIGTGAAIIGKVVIGDNVTVAPNSVVYSNIPDGCTALGNPAKVICRK